MKARSQPRGQAGALVPPALEEPKKEVVRLVLTVEYELDLHTDPLDIMEGVKELVEHARGYGRPTDAVISGLPTTINLRP